MQNLQEQKVSSKAKLSEKLPEVIGLLERCRIELEEYEIWREREERKTQAEMDAISKSFGYSTVEDATGGVILTRFDAVSNFVELVEKAVSDDSKELEEKVRKANFHSWGNSLIKQNISEIAKNGFRSKFTIFEEEAKKEGFLFGLMRTAISSVSAVKPIAINLFDSEIFKNMASEDVIKTLNKGLLFSVTNFKLPGEKSESIIPTEAEKMEVSVETKVIMPFLGIYTTSKSIEAFDVLFTAVKLVEQINQEVLKPELIKLLIFALYNCIREAKTAEEETFQLKVFRIKNVWKTANEIDVDWNGVVLLRKTKSEEFYTPLDLTTQILDLNLNIETANNI